MFFCCVRSLRVPTHKLDIKIGIELRPWRFEMHLILLGSGTHEWPLSTCYRRAPTFRGSGPALRNAPLIQYVIETDHRQDVGPGGARRGIECRNFQLPQRRHDRQQIGAVLGVAIRLGDPAMRLVVMAAAISGLAAISAEPDDTCRLARSDAPPDWSPP